MKNIENTENQQHNKSFPLKPLATIALALTLWACCSPSEKSIIQQREKVESISYELKSLIQARKWFVRKYNSLLDIQTNQQNQVDIEKTKKQLRIVISEYDEKIEKLSSNKIKAENKLNKDIAKQPVWIWLSSEPIKENRRDYLLVL